MGTSRLTTNDEYGIWPARQALFRVDWSVKQIQNIFLINEILMSFFRLSDSIRVFQVSFRFIPCYSASFHPVPVFSNTPLKPYDRVSKLNISNTVLELLLSVFRSFQILLTDNIGNMCGRLLLLLHSLDTLEKRGDVAGCKITLRGWATETTTENCTWPVWLANKF